MRRGLLTVGEPPVPLTVGYDFTGTPTGQVFSQFIWCDANPLNANGTITSVRASLRFAGLSIAFALISPTNIVRAITPNLTSVAETHTYAVDLTGEAGDYIGMWGSSNFWPRYTTTSGVTCWESLVSAKPGPGDSRSPDQTTNNRAVWLYGTG